MEKLKNITDKNPFKTPGDYFEEANRKIISSTINKETGSSRSGLIVRLRPFLAVAASFAVVLILGYSAMKLFSPGSDSGDIIPEISLQEFSESYLNDIDILMLEQNSDPLIMSGEVPDISKAEIIDYLLLENIYENEIFELL